MNDRTMRSDCDTQVADFADLEESLNKFNLRLRDMTARHLWHGASRKHCMTGLQIEGVDNDLEKFKRRGRHK